MVEIKEVDELLREIAKPKIKTGEEEFLEEIEGDNPTLYQDLRGAQKKARKYLRIIDMAIFLGITVLTGILSLLWGWLGFLLAVIIIGIFLGTTIEPRKVGQMERFTVEVLNNYLTLWGPGLHFKLRKGMNVTNEISLKEQVIRLFIAGEKLDVEQAKIGVKGVATIKANNPLLISYSLKGDTEETGPEKVKRLMKAEIQDAIQTIVKKHPENEREMTYNEVIALKGHDVKEWVWEEHPKTKEVFKSWGGEILKVILEDFEPPPEETEARRKVFEAQREIDRKGREVEIKRLEGIAEAERIRSTIWEMAKREAGIFKEDDKLSPEEIQKILEYYDVARATYLEDRSISAVKPTDKIVITEGKGVGKTVGRDVTREFIGRTVTKEKK